MPTSPRVPAQSWQRAGSFENLIAAPPRAETLITVQWLRFLAALLVVFNHVSDRLAAFAASGAAPYWIEVSGEFGVRIFFVISGFIMIYVAGDKFGGVPAAAAFLRNRALRIVPLYWTLTLVQAALMAAGLIGGAAKLSGEALIKSLLFIPYFNADGRHRPILGQGWTLDFEMLFYALFAVALLAPRLTGLTMLCAMLVWLAFGPNAGLPDALAIWTDPIVLYFLVGIGLGLLRRWLLERGPLPVLPLSPLLLSALIVAIYVGIDAAAPANRFEPLFVTLAVSAAVLCADAPRHGLHHRLAAFLGDASYSLYLAHGLALSLFTLLWRRFVGAEALGLYACLAVAAGVLAGVACYLVLERPLARLARQATRPGPRPAPAPTG